MKKVFYQAVLGLVFGSIPILGIVHAESAVFAYRFLPAFYEAAPRSMEVSMRQAVVKWCEATAVNNPYQYDSLTREPSNLWLCDGSHLRFLRSVDVRGKKQPRAMLPGFVCADDDELEDIKYYRDDMLSKNLKCTLVWYNAETRTYSLNRSDRG